MDSYPELVSHRFYEPFATTLAGFIVPMISGLISATSSALILYVILKSDIKLSSTYHHIMALMSCFDIISSIFIALGTIMMPSDNIYPFAGPMLGNKSTCQMQGWLIMFGIAGSTATNACLAIYFVCKITFKLRKQILTNYIEPAMHIYAVLLALSLPIVFLSNGLLNPNAYDSFCTIVPYPLSCDETEWYDWNKCMWSDGSLGNYIHNLTVATVTICIQFSLIVLCMSIILWSIQRNWNEINALDTLKWSDGSSSDIEEKETNRLIKMEELKYSRALIFQALLYIMAFFITWFFTFLSGVLNMASFELDAINSVLFSLQGFWNLLIFLFDKTYLMRKNHGGVMTFWQSVLKILTCPSDTPVIVLSNISTVQHNVYGDDANDIIDGPIETKFDQLYDEISEMQRDRNSAASQPGTYSSYVSENILANLSLSPTGSKCPEQELTRQEVVHQSFTKIRQRGLTS